MTIALSCFICFYTAWISYVKGWADSADGTPHKIGDPNDLWHTLTRRYEYFPALLSVPIAILIGHYFGPLPLVGAVPTLITARIWFRLGVLAHGKYEAWYGKKFSWWHALTNR